MALHFGQFLKQHLKQLNQSPHRLALALELDPSLMSKVLNGHRKPPKALLEKLQAHPDLMLSAQRMKAWLALSDYPPETLELALEAALDETAPRPTPPSSSSSSSFSSAAASDLVASSTIEGFYRFPCKGTVAAGGMDRIDTQPEMIYHEFWDVRQYATDMFTLVIRGHSMAPRFEDGGILLLRPAQTLKHKGLYVFQSNEGKRTFKLLQLSSEKGLLLPINPAYAPIPVESFSIEAAYEVLEYKKCFY